MKTSRISTIFIAILICSIIALHSSCIQKNEQQETALMPKTIKFDTRSDEYQELLSGEEDSVVFYSGLVTIALNGSGELHSTEDYEEIIIVLEGDGEVRLEDMSESLKIRYGLVGFIPTESTHQVYNTGEVPLKYIYVATRSK